MQDTIKRTGALTLDGSSNTSQTFLLDDGRWATSYLVFESSSSLQVSITVSGETNPTDFVGTVVNTKTATSYASGTTISVSAGDVLAIKTLGITALKVTRQGGSGTVMLTASNYPSEEGSAGTFALLQSAIKNEDVASAGADPGMVVNTRRTDTAAATSGTDGDYQPFITDANGCLWVSLGTLLAGEDQTNNVMKTEQRFSYSGVKTSDASIKSGAGFVHAIQVAQADAAPTAGTIQVRDATSAGTGTVIWEWNLTTAAFTPFTVILDVSFSTGLYIDFTTTADVNVTASYR